MSSLEVPASKRSLQRSGMKDFWTERKLLLELAVPAEDCVLPQFTADLIGFLDHEGQLHGIPLRRDCNTEI